jgi:hypothetical protein
MVTNVIFFLIGLYYYRKLNEFDDEYPRQMAGFIFNLGLSSLFGAIAHAIHYQLGFTTFKIVFVIMSVFSMLSMYYCFRAAYTCHLNGKLPDVKIINLIIVYIFIVMLLTVYKGSFLLIEINGGLALLYLLIAHARVIRISGEKGSRFIVLGIVISMLSIVVHLAKTSLHEYFNQKDLAHVIMIVALLFIGRGALIRSSGPAHED